MNGLMPLRPRTRLLLALLLLAACAALYLSGLHTSLTLESIKANQAQWLAYHAAHPILLSALFALAALCFFSLPLPGGSLVLLAAGSIFGWPLGFVLAWTTATLGACIALLISRFLLGPVIERRFGPQLARLHQGLADEGPFYVFALRLVPFLPFGIVNWLLGLTHIRPLPYAIATALGLLPGIALLTAAGTELARIDSVSDILSWRILLCFAALGLFPLLARRLLRLHRRA